MNKKILAGLAIGLFTVAMSANAYAAITPTPVPEPSTLLLLGGGLAGMVFFLKKKK